MKKKLTYGSVMDAIRSLHSDIEDVKMHDLLTFAVSETVTKNGVYKIQLNLPHKEIVNRPGIPRQKSDFIYVPYLVFIKYKKKVSK